MRERTRRRGGVPWWTPLLGLVVLAAGVAAGAGLTRTGAGSATAAAGRGVLGTRTTAVAPSPLATATAKATRKPRATPPVGSRLVLRNARVESVVGPRIFWVRTGPGRRMLVHLQGARGERRIHPGDQLLFRAVVARNRPGAATRWGLSIAEGRRALKRQGIHLEAYRPRVRFASPA